MAKPLCILAAVIAAVWGLSALGAAAGIGSFMRNVGEDPNLASMFLKAELGNPAESAESLWRYAIAGQSTLLRDGLYSVSESVNTYAGGDVSYIFEGEDVGSPPPEEVSPPPASASPPENSPAVFQDVETDEAIRTITIAPSGEAGYDVAEGVYIKNATEYGLDMAGMLASTLKLELSKDAPQILIIHTHASEAYYPTEENAYTPTDTDRTEDTNFNVVRVGDALAQALTDLGFNVIHERSIFDYPSYNGSYIRSLKAILEQLEENPTIGVVIDLHRDAMNASDGAKYRPVVEIDGEKAAQVMLVVGSAEGGLSHENWRQNLAFAAQLQREMNERYPGLARPINLRTERFNQHATTGSLLIEIGTTGNTLEEALRSVDPVAESLAGVLEGYVG